MAPSPGVTAPTGPQVETVTVTTLVVGAGFSGLCAAIRLQEDGERDFVVIERGSDVGGTWRDNTYPGAACDVPSQLYSFSFAPNPEWSSSYSPQPEIQAYIQSVAERSGTLDRFVFDTSVEDLAWDDAARRWRVTTSGATYDAQFVVLAAGALSAPKLPAIEGVEGFQGELFHSAQWDHSVDLAGKRVAVIGTGASAIQLVPEVAKRAAHLDVYQRTAPWILPRVARRYTRAERLAMRHVPGVQKAYRIADYWIRESNVPSYVRYPALTAAPRALGLLNIRRGIKDPELRRKVTPDFTPFCKRILLSNDWYPTLDQPHVDLVTEGIGKVTGNAVVTADGTEREIDVLIVATGFYTTDLPIAEHVVGREGRTLRARWDEVGMSAYKGATVPEFPNLFFVVGPNTGLGHSSMVFMIESQVAYLTDAVRTARELGLATVEVSEEAAAAYNDDLQERMRPTVWNVGGCSSWYLDEHGRNTTLWPRSTFAFRAETRHFDRDAYAVTPATTHPLQEASA
jgi:cyclohexanone monooxygenase